MRTDDPESAEVPSSISAKRYVDFSLMVGCDSTTTCALSMRGV
jgi:hypothetical protein